MNFRNITNKTWKIQLEYKLYLIIRSFLYINDILREYFNNEKRRTLCDNLSLHHGILSVNFNDEK